MCAVKVNGLEGVIKDLQRLNSNYKKIVFEELKKIADEILADAISRVPVDTGHLKGSAYINQTENGYAIGFSAFYAPYVEFGTGDNTFVPVGYGDFAMEFFVNGKGNGRPQAYLFPAFLARRDSILSELEIKLSQYVKSK